MHEHREHYVNVGRKFAPEKALILHSHRTSYSLESFITVHDIENGEVRAGRPLSRGALLSICSLVLPGIASKPSYLPENILCYSDFAAGASTLIWWKAPSTQYLMFTKGMGVSNGRAPLPGLVFRVRNGSLNVWAVRGKERPRPATELCELPLPNISGGAVCMGNVQLEAKALPEHAEMWERAFFQSAFSPHHTIKMVGTKPFAAFWNDLIGSKRKSFPEQVLNPTTTLQDVMESGR